MVVEEDLESERKEIIRRYRRLLRKAKPILKDGDAKIIRKHFILLWRPIVGCGENLANHTFSILWK